MANENPLASYQSKALVGENFNADAYHAMQERDDSLIRDQVLHGYTGKEFVYQFTISGKQVTGVSVVGARELASKYGGIKARIVASVDKTGSLFVFKSFEPLAIQAQMIPQLQDEEDFYEVVMEISDIKTGNSIQVRKKEKKTEQRSQGKGGGSYERPHYDVIAESKAYRNGVLSIIPQNVVQQFEERALAAGNTSKEKTIDQYRDGILGFASKNSIALERQAVGDLLFSQIRGLGDAANQGLDAFKEAAEVLGILRAAATIEHQPEQRTPPASPPPPPPPAAKNQNVKNKTPTPTPPAVSPAATPATAATPAETPAAEPGDAAAVVEESGPGPLKYGDVSKALAAATTIDELAEIALDIPRVPNPAHQGFLKTQYDDCEAALNGVTKL